MKISNWIKPPKLTAKGDRLDVSRRLAPASQTPDPGRRLQLDAAGLKKTNRNTLRGKIQNFSYHSPAARSVQLAGDFTGWLGQPINLRKGPNGTWRTALRLERGTHYYRFLVDGQWCDDPECSLYVPNSFGSQNAVWQVP